MAEKDENLIPKENRIEIDVRAEIDKQKDQPQLPQPELRQTDIEKPEDRKKVQNHEHDGNDADKIKVRNIDGFFEVLSATPTHKPKSLWDQIKIVNNAGTRELWVYDYLADSWHQI